MNTDRNSILLRLAPYFVLLAGLIPLAMPYLEPGYPFADDRFAPYLRVQAVRAAVADGQFPPRWFSEFDGGYGSPYPSFYAMLFYDLAAAFYAAGVSVGASVELTAFLAIGVAALGMFFLAKSLWGFRAGFLAAALYTYAPYHLVDAFVRGALSELAAFAWFPLVVHTTYQAVLTRRRLWIVLSAISTAGLILTHNLMPIIFLPVMIGFLGVVSLLRKEKTNPSLTGVATVAASSALGLLLSAYFWLPILLERGLLRLEYFLQYDFHGDFVGRGTLFAWSSSEPPYASIGMILLGAAILGALVALKQRASSPHSVIAIGALGAGLLFLFMTTRKSSWIWEHAPILAFVQFPWRFLAPASFCLALAAGPLPDALRKGALRWGVVAILGLGIYIQSAPLIRISRRVDGPTIQAMAVCQEIWGTQDYRPATSRTLFWRGPTPPGDPGDPLVLLPCQGKLDISPMGKAQVLSTTRRGTHWNLRYAADVPATVTIPQFFFPGWEAWVDGVRTRVEPSPGNGLLTITLPSGNHALRIDYADTAARRASDMLSLLGLATVAAIALSARSRSGVRGDRRSGGDGNA